MLGASIMNNVVIQILIRPEEHARFREIQKEWGVSDKWLVTYFIKEGIKNAKRTYTKMDGKLDESGGVVS